MRQRFSWQRSAFLALLLALAVSGCGSDRSNAHAQTVFSSASIKGSYGISYIVALPNASGPTQFFSGTGVYQADGAGHLTGEETTNTNGEVCSGTLNGTYTVDPNGTGTVSVTFSPTTPGCSAGSFQQRLVIMQSGRIVRVADTIPTEVTIFEEWQKQM